MKYEFNNEEHLHLLDGKPLTGTSSVSKVLGNPALTWWASARAVETLGWLDPKKNSPESVKTALREGYNRVKGLSFHEYEKALAEAYKAHSKRLKEAADKGTDLHAELEKYVKWHMRKTAVITYDEKILPFVDWATKNVKRFIASEAHCYDEELWVGGITDAVAELNDGKLAIIDFKSAKDAYTSHFIQASGYCIQVEKNGLFSEDGEHSIKLDRPIEALIVVPFGAEKVEPHFRYDIENYKKGFKNCVELYRLLGFDKIN